MQTINCDGDDLPPKKEKYSSSGIAEASSSIEGFALCHCVVPLPQANIDFQCRQLKLGLRPTDLVRELTVSFFCPLQLSRECYALPLLVGGPLELSDRLFRGRPPSMKYRNHPGISCFVLEAGTAVPNGVDLIHISTGVPGQAKVSLS